MPDLIRARFGIALTPEIFAGVDARQEALLLSFGAEFEQHRSAHHQSERDQRRRAGVSALFLEDIALNYAPGRSAPIDRPRGRDPALRREQPMPALQVLPGKLSIVDDFVAQLLGEVLTQPAAHFVAEGDLFSRIVEVHRCRSGWWRQ